jgi:hypothetical protein
MDGEIVGMIHAVGATVSGVLIMTGRMLVMALVVTGDHGMGKAKRGKVLFVTCQGIKPPGFTVMNIQ